MRIAVVNSFFPPRVGGSAGLRIVRLPAATVPSSRLSVSFDIAFTARPGAYESVSALLGAFRPDVVHQHGQFFDLTWLTGWWAHRHGVPVLLSVHTRLENPVAAYRGVFRSLDAVLAWDWAAFTAALAHIALPAATLAFPALATLVRFTRAGVLEVIQSGFVLNERAMGLPPSVIVWKYILRSALTSTVTQIGLLFGILLAGAVVTETVFDWPGIGTYAVNSIIRSDYNAVMGFTVWAGTIFLAVNLLVDLAHTVVDPRERMS